MPSSIHASEPHECSSSKCKVILPGDYGFKTCEKCRTAKNKSKKRSAEKDKEKNTTQQATGKRAREEADHPASRSVPCPPLQNTSSAGHEEVNNDNSDGDDDDEGADSAQVMMYDTSKQLFKTMRETFRKNSKLTHFRGKYRLPQDALGVDAHERVKMTVFDVWKATEYRFTQYTRKKKSKMVQDPEDQRDTLGMKRYDCKSRLIITARMVDFQMEVFIRMDHHDAHFVYKDVSMPETALEYIRDHLQFKPNDLVKALRPDYRNIASAQVYSAWLRLSEILWKRDSDQMKSALCLLKELEKAGDVDVFDSTSVDGITQLAWGMKKVAQSMKGCTVVEIGIDATYNTNSKRLELYGVLAEHDGAGYPLAYCLLSTASSTILGKRILALELFARQLRDRYGIRPRHYHVDKDMAEIRVAQKVWPGASISLCYWHLNRAIEERLKKIKLSTTPYNFIRAHQEYSFIDLAFRPEGLPDASEYEGGCLEPLPPGAELPSATPNPNSILLRLPATQPRPKDNAKPQETPTQPSPTLDPDENEGKRVFCPRHLRQSVLDMIGRHYCAHPMIPGYSAPTPEGIRYWAVKEMYQFCYGNDLRELWAYLWENWYRSGRWALWARSSNPYEIPQLKTTMILESHWKHIKHDYLDHFSNPRIDFLIWTVVVKAGAAYLNSFENIMIDDGRWTHRASWRKDFKREWQRLQSVRDVDPVFFWEVQWNRTAPWYTHPSLQPLDPSLKITTAPVLSNPNIQVTDEEDGCSVDQTESDEDMDNTDDDELANNFETSELETPASGRARLLRLFADGLDFQDQFQDHRFSKALEKNGRLLFRMAEQCLRKEQLMNDTRSSRPSTWDPSLSEVMFWRMKFMYMNARMAMIMGNDNEYDEGGEPKTSRVFSD
ncbi:hypothetical protein V5O48_007186 [Marasmius crinis-equi]|uniref:MULE transposase domain-containing protein n=1 Tax=Marasmius crinis-equi TaxID=585013 RepID=A0ABR3FHG3_9AGAR